MPWPALEHWSTALSQARYSFSSRRRRGARSVLHTQPAQLALPGRPPATSSLCRCCRAKPPPALAAPSLVLTLLGRACPLLPPPSGFCRSWTPAGLSVAVSRYPRAIPPPPLKRRSRSPSPCSATPAASLPLLSACAVTGPLSARPGRSAGAVAPPPPPLAQTAPSLTLPLVGQTCRLSWRLLCGGLLGLTAP